MTSPTPQDDAQPAARAETRRKSRGLRPRRRPAPARLAQPLRDRSLAHDLKNLMTVVVSATEALALAEAEDPERRVLAEASREAARRGASVLLELMAAHEPLRPTRDVVDVTEVCAATARLAAAALPPGVTLSLDRHARPLYGAVSRRDLEAAVMNLCKNAGEACTGGGEVAVSMTRLGPAAAEAAGLPRRRSVRIQVRDTGAGMTPDAGRRAGEPGFTTKGGGEGLGLFSVAEFARRQGGALRIEAPQDRGAVVNLYLPLSGAGDA